jgi:hypothetical protein
MASLELFPLYFPQLYQVPENYLWCGNGFTDWDGNPPSKYIPAFNRNRHVNHIYTSP